MELITAHLPLHSHNYKGEQYVFSLYVNGRKEEGGEGEPDNYFYDSSEIENVGLYVGKAKDYEEVLDTELIEELKKDIGEGEFKELLRVHGA